jgi:F-type H+-transporting ATPase subunit b
MALLVGAALLFPCAAAAQEKAAEDHGQKTVSADDHGAPAGKAKADEHGGQAAGEHGAAEHGADEFDIGHGNATPALNQPQEWRFDLSIWTFVVFLLLLAILTKFAWGPIAAALEQREETIARQIEEARLASEKAATQLKAYEARLAAATDEARQIVAGARKDAEIAKDKIVAEARDAAGKERDRAVADIHTAKNQALQEIAQKSVETAVTLAGNILRREVKPQEHEALIGDAMNQFSKLN